VGASTRAGTRAAFSNAGSTVTLAAPGVHVLGAVARASNMGFQSAALPGSTAGAYGYGSGTSYAAPQVAGAAALVWAANPALTAAEVADVLRRSASGRGTWNADTGYGVLDVANAVALAGTGL
jgi:serine protease